MKLVITSLLLVPVLTICQSQQNQTPIDQAKVIINDYKGAASTQDKQQLKEFLEYYRHWYQAVTPPPHGSYKRLTSKAQEVVNKIRKLGDTFAKKTTTRPGESRLSQEGEKFYQEVLTLLS